MMEHQRREASAGAPRRTADEADGVQRLERIVTVVRDLAREVGGDRAAAAVTAEASFERDVGLGSLERVELLTRIEDATGRHLDERYLLLDSASEMAGALAGTVELPAARSRVSGATPLPSTMVLGDVATLVEALRRRAMAEPGRVHVHVHEDDGAHDLTYGALWHAAQRIAASLVTRGVRPREPVAIMLPTSRDYLQAFMGVQLAGAIPVPLYPPARLDRLGEYLTRQSRILANAESRVMIAMPEAIPVARLLGGAASIVTVAELRDTDASAELPVVGAADPALIQYTSGSTGDPKGVVLTHANLLANIRAIAAGIDLRPDDIAVSWLPLYHDMGLIGTWLFTLVHGIPLTLMSPLAFLARPERWLQAIHERRATLSAAPNFAYELCVRKVSDEALAGLDLSSWRVTCNGSEPVRAETLERFMARFGPHGFREEAMYPVYGLAEASVALTFPTLGTPPRIDVVAREPYARDGRAIAAEAGDATPLRFVSVGRALPAHDVRLVDDAGRPVPDRVVGHLQFRGPSCMAGYYRNREATSHAQAADGWIESGDLAYCSEGDVFITGRAKDLIIKGGRNLVPQEIEEMVGGVAGIRNGCVAAFGVADDASGTEQLVVVAETRTREPAQLRQLQQAVIGEVSATVGVPPDAVLLVAPGVVPKTPSGKVRRSAAHDLYVAGTIGESARLPWRLRLALAAGAVAGAARGAFRRIARAAIVTYLSVAWAVGAVICGPVVAVLLLVLPAGRAVRLLTRAVSRMLLGVSGCRVVVEGSARLPAQGPVVLVSNHTSYADAVILSAALPIDFVFAAMAELRRWPVIGRFVRRGEHPLVDRWQLSQSLADAGALTQRLRKGETVLFFAEGGFARERGLRALRLGAFEAAVATGAPVVPVALRGARELLPFDARIPHPGPVHVWIGAPIVATGDDWAATLALRGRVADAIAAHCGEPRYDGGGRTG